MNKLVSKNPVQRFKLGNRIVKFKQAGKITYAIRDGRLVKHDPSVGHQEYVNSNQDALNIYNKTAIFNGGGVGGGSRGGSNTTAPKITNYSGTTWNFLNSKANQFGGWKTNTNGNRYFTITNDDGSKVNVFGNGQMYNQNGKLIGSITKQDIINTQRKTPVRKPAVTKPAVVANRAAAVYTLPEGVADVMATQKMLMDNGWDGGTYGADGKWGKETQAAWEAYNKNKLAANAGGTTETTPNVTSTPTSTGTTVSGNGYSFTLPTNTNTNANTNIYESYYPGTYSNLNNMFTRKGIRSNRGTNYSNVNEYWDWLQNNKDSEDYKVWSNIMGNDGYLNKEIFDNVMSQYGIRGNLGRRDSGRLSNLLNDLNLIGVKGSDARKAFLTNFNKNLPSSEEINEYVRTNTPARPNLSTINWGLYPNTISSDNPFININKSKYTRMFPAGTKISDILNNNISFNSTPYYRLYKNGGLISKNPIKRFKSNFR